MILTNTAPAPNTINVRRDWSLTADVTDALGIDVGTVVLQINGATVTPTTTSITDGYRIEYVPGSSSGYGERVNVEISADVTGGSTETQNFRFTTATGMTEATSSPPPLVVVVRDITIDPDEADENHNGTEVVWLTEKTHPLIVTEDQAQAVGVVAVDDNTYHQHRRTLQVYRIDQNDDAVAELQEGDLIDYVATAINETAQKAEVLAIRQTVDQNDDVLYQLVVQHYEKVAGFVEV